MSSRPPSTITVQASSTSLLTMVFVPMLGFTGVALSLLMLSGQLTPRSGTATSSASIWCLRLESGWLSTVWCSF